MAKSGTGCHCEYPLKDEIDCSWKPAALCGHETVMTPFARVTDKFGGATTARVATGQMSKRRRGRQTNREKNLIRVGNDRLPAFFMEASFYQSFDQK
jgi:hypothetical protein